MKHLPYREIINLNDEAREYALLCRRKSTTYKHYSDWEEHITEHLKKFPTKKDLYNFKHFCINKERTTSQSPQWYGAGVGCAVSVISASFLEDLKDLELFSQLQGVMRDIVWYIVEILLCIIVGLLFKNFIDEMESLCNRNYFYKDIIELIEKVEGKSNEE